MAKQIKAWERVRRRLEARPRLRAALCSALVCMMTGLQWLQLDLSCGTRIVYILGRKWPYLFLNLGLVFFVDLALLVLIRRRGGVRSPWGAYFSGCGARRTTTPGCTAAAC